MLIIAALFRVREVEPRLLTLYPLAHKTSSRNCVFYFGVKMAVAGAFTQAKTSTNNFSVIPQKIAKVNSLGGASMRGMNS